MHATSNNTTQVQSPLLTPAGSMEYLTISKSKFYQLQREGKLRPIRIGGVVRYQRAALDALIAESMTGTEA